MSEFLTFLDRFNALKERVLRSKRIAGMYILEAVEVPSPGRHLAGQDAFLREFASRHGFSLPDVDDAEWVNAEVFRSEARERLIEVLVGGAEIGHSRWDVPPADAEAIACAFLSLFGEDARFFCDRDTAGHAQVLAPYARPDFFDYIFGGGCVAIDRRIAGVFWVLDND